MNGGNARMDRIVIAFAHNAAREKAGLLLEQCGHPACASVRSGAEVLRMVRSWDGAVVVCGYRLADMTVDTLSERIEGRAKLLLLASPANLALVDDHRIARVPSPVSRQAFLEALQALLGEKRPPEEASATRRTPEEIALIDHAKQLLIERGMSEPQAHSLLQQRSMRNRCRLVETARQVIITCEINARH